MSRGTVVDDAALIKALKERKIHSAGLDVFVNEPEVPKEYLAMDNVVLFPHLGSSTVHTRQKMDQLVVDNLLAWAAGKPPLTPVPETPWPPKNWLPQELPAGGVIICRHDPQHHARHGACRSPSRLRWPRRRLRRTAPPEQCRAAPPAPRTMVGSWEFSNADREKICTITFRNDAAKVGKRRRVRCGLRRAISRSFARSPAGS